MYQIIDINTNTVQINNSNFLDEDYLDQTITDLIDYGLILTPPMDSPDSDLLSPPSTSDSSSHAYNLQEIQPLSILPGPSRQTQDFHPYLEIIEEPAENFRFRYKSEMSATHHGSLTGRKSNKVRKRTYPTVQLHNYDSAAVIRCSLYQCNKDRMIQRRQPHAHRLVKKQGSGRTDDPHEVEVNPESGFVATFTNMGIIHTAKSNVPAELERKISGLKVQELARNAGSYRPLSKKEKQEIKAVVDTASRCIDLNVVCLQFAAFKVEDNIYYPLCDSVYSAPINNLKSAMTGELKIVRMDHWTSPASGGKEIFILVERVKKRNIKIRFYELDNQDNEIWCAEGGFNELDVHHQYAIVFKTPAYRILDIEDDVKVFLELQRPTDGARSEPREFIYTPTGVPSRKRPRLTYVDSNLSSNQQPPIISNVPAVQHGYQRPLEDFINPNVVENVEVLNTEEINSCLNSLTPEIIAEYFEILGTDAPQEIIGKPVVEDDSRCTSSSLRNPDSSCLNSLTPEIITEYFETLGTDAPQEIIRKPVVEDDSRCTSSSLRNLDSAEEKIVTMFREEFLAFLKTNPPKRRVSMMLENLFEKSAKISENMESVLHLLISENYQNFLIFLLKVLHRYQLSDLVNMPNSRGQTALHLAVECHNQLAVEHLLYTKADITMQDLEGNTVFHIASLKNAPRAILKLLCAVKDANDCINAVNYDGLTALHLAVNSNNITATEMLCQRNADINAQDKKTGNTVLHVAVVDQRIDIVKFLLENLDVDVKKENYAEYSSFKLAKLLAQKKDTPITRKINELLENYMGKFKDTLPMSPDDIKERYGKVKAFTEECLNEVSEILNKSGTWRDLAESLGYGHLVRTNICVSSQNLLQFAMKKEESIYKIRNCLEDLDELRAVQCIDNMVL